MKTSDRAVGILVVIAIAISLAGTFFTVNIISSIMDISYFPAGQTDLTGMATGHVNVTVNESVSITLIVPNVTFGPLNPVGLGLPFTNNTEDNNPRPITIRNDGSTTVNITIDTTEDLWSSVASPSAYFTFKCGTNSSTCDTTGGDPPSVTTFTNVPKSSQTLVIWNMSRYDSSDQLEVEFNVSVPASEPASSNEVDITLTAKVSCPGDADC